MNLYRRLVRFIMEIRLMAAIDNLNAAVQAVQAAVPVVTARIDALKASEANAAAQHDPAIQAAADALNGVATALTQAAQ